MRSGEHALFDAYQATGPDRAYVAARLRAFARIGNAFRDIGNAFRDIGVTVAEASARLTRGLRAWEAASLSANRSRHDPRKTP